LGLSLEHTPAAPGIEPHRPSADDCDSSAAVSQPGTIMEQELAWHAQASGLGKYASIIQ
jgi:hypothetical protein